MKETNEKNLNTALKEYCNSNMLPMHMPGHKRSRQFSYEPFLNDITEIPGFDNLHDTEENGLISNLQDEIASFYNTQTALLSVNGSTGALMTAIAAMTKRGDKILAARNCHMSVWNSCEILGLDAITVAPEFAYNGEFSGKISPNSIAEALDNYPDIKLAVIVSPTYEGIISDVAQIASVCHERGVRLLVDSAHGAHLHDGKDADAVVRSLHKTLACPTSTAVLLTDNSRLAQDFVHYKRAFETSSPSYILMQGVSVCFGYIREHPGCFDDWRAACLKYKKVLSNNLRNLKLAETDDYSKIIILTNGYISGKALAQALRETHQIEVEAALSNHIIAMTGMGDNDETIGRLSAALLEIDAGLAKKDEVSLAVPVSGIGKITKISENYRAKHEIIAIEDSVGRISGESIWNYPPGIPIILPGEIITASQAHYLSQYCGRSKIEVVLLD